MGELPIEDWRWTLEVDLFGVIHGCHVFAPILRRQGHGHVLNVASAAGLLSPPFMGAYNVAKAGVIALSETLRAELVGHRGQGDRHLPDVLQDEHRRTAAASPTRSSGSARQGLVDGGKSAEPGRARRDRVGRSRELYALPMADGRWLWRVKRAAPAAFSAARGPLGTPGDEVTWPGR